MKEHVVLTRVQNKLGNEKRRALFKLGINPRPKTKQNSAVRNAGHCSNLVINHVERHVLGNKSKFGNEQRRARFKVDTKNMCP